MGAPNFREMSPEDFEAFHPRTEDEATAHEAESAFRDWCLENEEDPQDEDARAAYNEMKEETGEDFWNRMDKDDLAGWTDNMNKD